MYTILFKNIPEVTILQTMNINNTDFVCFYVSIGSS